MQIDIQSRGLRLTGSLLEHVVQRVRHLLAHAGDHIRSVRVRLFDIKGPHGGQDKRCVVQVRLNHLPAVVTEETQVHLEFAVDCALGRAGRTVKRRLERPRERRRGMPRNLAQLHVAQLRLNPTSRTLYPHSIH